MVLENDELAPKQSVEKVDTLRWAEKLPEIIIELIKKLDPQDALLVFFGLLLLLMFTLVYTTNIILSGLIIIILGLCMIVGLLTRPPKN